MCPVYSTRQNLHFLEYINSKDSGPERKKMEITVENIGYASKEKVLSFEMTTLGSKIQYIVIQAFSCFPGNCLLKYLS